MKQWYESLFDNYAKKYDQECFVQGTAGECERTHVQRALLCP